MGVLIFFAFVVIFSALAIGRAAILDLREARTAGRTVLSIRQTFGRD